MNEDKTLFLDSLVFCMGRDSLRVTAKKIGISAATLHRVLSGKKMDAVTFAKIIVWMGPDKSTLKRIILCLSGRNPELLEEKKEGSL